MCTEKRSQRKILKGHLTLSNRMTTYKHIQIEPTNAKLCVHNNASNTHTHTNSRNLVTKTILLTRRILWFFIDEQYRVICRAQRHEYN